MTDKRKIEILQKELGELQKKYDLISPDNHTGVYDHNKQNAIKYKKEYTALINKLKKMQLDYQKVITETTVAKMDYEKQMQDIGFKPNKLRRFFYTLKLRR